MREKIEEYIEIMANIRVGCKVALNHKAHVGTRKYKDSYIITEILPCDKQEDFSKDHTKSCRYCIGKIRLEDYNPQCCSLEYKFGLDIISQPFMNFISEEEMEI